MTKWYLFSKLGQKGSEPCTLHLSNGTYVDGIVQAVERESGCGQSYNVRIAVTGKGTVMVHVKTVD